MDMDGHMLKQTAKLFNVYQDSVNAFTNTVTHTHTQRAISGHSKK